MDDKAHDERKQESERQALIERWRRRQKAFGALLEEWKISSYERRVDWSGGRVEWLDPMGEPAASATMQALCSYSFQDEWLMMAWANRDETASVIDPLPGIPDYIEPCSEGDAWLWAMYLAESSGVEYLYRIATGSHLVFLGLYSPALLYAPVESGSPQAFVLGLLDALYGELEEHSQNPVAMRRLFLNQGESLHQNAQLLYDEGADPSLLQRTVNTLLDVGNSVGQRRFGLLPPLPLTDKEVKTIREQVVKLRAQWLRVGTRELYTVQGEVRAGL